MMKSTPEFIEDLKILLNKHDVFIEVDFRDLNPVVIRSFNVDGTDSLPIYIDDLDKFSKVLMKK